MPGPVSFLKQIKCINCKSNSRVVVVANGVFRPPEFMLLSKLSRNWFHLGCLEVIFHPYTRIIAARLSNIEFNAFLDYNPLILDSLGKVFRFCHTIRKTYHKMVFLVLDSKLGVGFFLWCKSIVV